MPCGNVTSYAFIRATRLICEFVIPSPCCIKIKLRHIRNRCGYVTPGALYERNQLHLHIRTIKELAAASHETAFHRSPIVSGLGCTLPETSVLSTCSLEVFIEAIFPASFWPPRASTPGRIYIYIYICNVRGPTNTCLFRKTRKMYLRISRGMFRTIWEKGQNKYRFGYLQRQQIYQAQFYKHVNVRLDKAL